MRYGSALAAAAIFVGVTLAATAAASDYADAIQAGEPVAYWRLDDEGSAAAETIAGRAGTYLGSASPGQPGAPVDGAAGRCAAFGGTPGTRIEVDYSGTLNPVSGLTVAAWARPTGGDGFRAVVSSRDEAPAAGYIIYAGPADGVSEPRWQFWTGGSTTTTWNFLGRNRSGFGLGPVATPNTWAHVVGTFAVSGPADSTGRYPGTQQLYVNGELVLSRTGLFYRPNLRRDLFIGAGQNEAPDNFNWVGQIDEVALYDRALSPAEIRAHYELGTPAAAALDYAFDGWTSLFRGISLGRGRSDGGVGGRFEIQMLRVDLGAPGVEVFTTPGNGATTKETTSQTAAAFLEQYNQAVAVNAMFFAPCCSTTPESKDVIGLAISEGDVVSPAITDAAVGAYALAVTRSQAAHVIRTIGGVPPLEYDTAVGGSEIILAGGDIVATPSAASGFFGPNPRTAAGVSADGRALYLLTIDGRQAGYSGGATLTETAAWLRHLGATDGLNLDGGGSTTMVRAGSAGAAELLNRPVGRGAPNTLRRNGNQLGVAARPLGGADLPGDCDADGVSSLAEARRMAACLGGPDEWPATYLTGSCICERDFDADDDGDVDLLDAAVVQMATDD